LELDRKPFLSTHRANTVCAREFDVLSDLVEKGARALHAEGPSEPPTVRRSPGRCIVQLGPVAITVAWLHSAMDPIAEGELLVIVWRGKVAPPVAHIPERAPLPNASSSATSVWEGTFMPVAASEETWQWQATDEHLDGFTSTRLAAVCVERLRLAHELT
jgi:hypothetical protein